MLEEKLLSAGNETVPLSGNSNLETLLKYLNSVPPISVGDASSSFSDAQPEPALANFYSFSFWVERHPLMTYVDQELPLGLPALFSLCASYNLELYTLDAQFYLCRYSNLLVLYYLGNVTNFNMISVLSGQSRLSLRSQIVFCTSNQCYQLALDVFYFSPFLLYTDGHEALCDANLKPAVPESKASPLQVKPNPLFLIPHLQVASNSASLSVALYDSNYAGFEPTRAELDFLNVPMTRTTNQG